LEVKMSVKRVPWTSLAILIVCYASFGWHLAGLPSPKPDWLMAKCSQIIGETLPTETEVRQEPTAGKERSRVLGSANESSETSPAEKATKPLGEAPAVSPPTQAAAVPTSQPKTLCRLAHDHNLFTATLAILWIILSSIAFIAPLTSFSAFITRWVHSDTVAFTAIFLFAALAAVVLYWLHVFAQILTILAAETLARIDLQTRSMNGMQSFWILTVVCLIGLGLGWMINTIG
jgi:hypothetical protein